MTHFTRRPCVAGKETEMTTQEKMTVKEAKAWVRSHDDDDSLDESELIAAFTAIFGRAPDRQNHDEGLWSHLCAAVS